MYLLFYYNKLKKLLTNIAKYDILLLAKGNNL